MSVTDRATRVREGLAAGFAVLAGFVSSAPSFAQCTAYSVDVIEGPPCRFMYSVAEAQGINEAGAICGGYLDCGEVAHPVIWSATGAMTPIPLSTEFGAPFPWEVNFTGQVAGVLSVPGLSPPDRAFRFADGVTTNLGVLPGHNWSQAYAINDNGVVCGASNNTSFGPLTAFVWQDGQMSALNLPFGKYSEAHDISNSGQICGWMGDTIATARAFVWQDGVTQDLGVMPGGDSAVAYGVSNNGKVCGGGVVHDGKSLVFHGFFYSNGKMTDIGTLPGLPYSRGRSVNDAGQLVGRSYNEFGVGPEIIWQNGVMTRLNDLIPPEAQINVITAWSINNSGQIVGRAIKLDSSGDIVAVRLTPIPSVPGDFNCDRLVNTADLLGVINHWGFTGNPADFNHDGTVNAADIAIVIQNWG